jgi:ribosomal protein L7/L12
LAARLDYVERQVAALWRQQQFGVPYVPFSESAQASSVPGTPTAGPVDQGSGLPPEVVALIRAGRKIDAITEYRRITGKGLREAKLAVDSLL